MTLVAILLYLSLTALATPTPLHLLTPQLLSLPPTLAPLNQSTPVPPNATTLTARAQCFIQPQDPRAPRLFDADHNDCLVAVRLLPAATTPYTFGRRPDAQVRLPYARSFRTCKVIIDIMDEMETERLRWVDICDTLEAPRGVLNRCLGQVVLPSLGGRTSVGERGAMQAIVVGQAWRAGAAG